MSNGQADQATELLTLLDQQVRLQRRLHELAGSQRRLIETGATEGLLEVLGQRQTLVEQLQTLTARLEPLRKIWPVVCQRLTVPQRLRVERLVAEANRLLEQTMQIDEKDSQTLGAAKDQAAQALRTTQSGATAAAAYASASTRGRFLNSTDGNP